MNDTDFPVEQFQNDGAHVQSGSRYRHIIKSLSVIILIKILKSSEDYFTVFSLACHCLERSLL